MVVVFRGLKVFVRTAVVLKRKEFSFLFHTVLRTWFYLRKKEKKKNLH